MKPKCHVHSKVLEMSLKLVRNLNSSKIVKSINWIFQTLLVVISSLNFQSSYSQTCFICSPRTNFACISTTQYVKCNTTAIDLSVISTCPSPLICNSARALNNPLITVPCHIQSTTLTPSCTVTPITIVTAPFNSTVWCTQNNQVGQFVHPTLNCTWYVRCLFVDSVMVGNQYKCPGTTRFNAVTKYCDANKTSCP